MTHNKLLSKLRRYGITDGTLNLILTFLKQSRTFNCVHVDSGVPQGTI